MCFNQASHETGRSETLFNDRHLYLVKRTADYFFEIEAVLKNAINATIKHGQSHQGNQPNKMRKLSYFLFPLKEKILNEHVRGRAR